MKNTRAMEIQRKRMVKIGQSIPGTWAYRVLNVIHDPGGKFFESCPWYIIPIVEVVTLQNVLALARVVGRSP